MMIVVQFKSSFFLFNNIKKCQLSFKSNKLKTKGKCATWRLFGLKPLSQMRTEYDWVWLEPLLLFVKSKVLLCGFL